MLQLANEGGNKHIDPELRNSGLVVVAANYRLLPKAKIKVLKQKKNW